MHVDKEVWNEECQLLDISLGGCSLKLSYRALDIPIGAVFMMDFQIGKHEPFIQIGRVCYKKLEKFDGKSRVKVGVQFVPYPKYSTQLRSLVQNLAVELFTNWSQRKST
jgi:hypothetical protein